MKHRPASLPLTRSTTSRLAPCVAWFLLGLLPLTALAQAPRDCIRQGNEFYAAGRYAEALESYEKAAAVPGASQSVELLHDQAAARFKLGQIAEARELWVRAKTLGDATSEARTRYNLANCDYADALAAVQKQDARKSLELLAQAAEQYREALGLDPSLADARANLELTQVLRKQIEEQSQSQPDSQPSQDQSQQKQDQKKSESQPSQSQPSQQSAESQPSDQQESSSSQPATQPSPSSQPAEQEQDEQEQKPNEQQKPEDQSAEEDKQKEDQQAEAQSQPAAESQPASAESQPAEGESKGDQPPGIRLTPTQAERLLQMVRDAEKARREMLAAQARQRAAREKKVERDW